MPRFIDPAICLRDSDWSESSQLLVMLTQTHGKVRALAKGSRRQSPSAVARFSGGVNLLNLGQASISTRPAGKLAALTEWDLRDDHYHLRTCLAAQWSAMYAADLASAMLAEEDPHPGVFDAMKRLLAELAKPDEVDAALLRFQWALLSDVGYRPELANDVMSAQPLAEAKAYSFDPVLGGLTMRNGMNDEAWRVRGGTVQLLRAVAAGRPEDLNDVEAVRRANRLLCSYARALLDKELPTMRWLLGSGNNRQSNIAAR